MGTTAAGKPGLGESAGNQAGLEPLRRAIRAASRWVVFGFVALALSACGGLNVGDLFSDSGPSQPTIQAPLPQAPAGAGRVALLLPLSAPGETSKIATAMKQAAELALFDAGNAGIALVTKDTGGTAQGAEAAARAALDEGAQLILGPLLAAEVQTAAPLARERGVPIVAFSSVSAAAGSGTYLMSFLPEEEVLNAVRHAVSTGRRNIAALIPKSQYGATVERALAEAAKTYRADIVVVERYPRTVGGIVEPARRITRAIRDPGRAVQALIIPEGGQLLSAAGNALIQSGFSPTAIKVLGTGLWDDVQTRSTTIAIGGWYAGVSPALIAQFGERYKKTYTVDPPRLASLAYDAASLAITLGRQQTPDRFSGQRITNPQGFQGVNGLFRFRSDGRIERGLSILQVSATGPVVIAPAPVRFDSGS